MEEVENMSNSGRKEVSTSYSGISGTRRPMLHYVSDGIEDHVFDDDTEDNFVWTNRFLRGWLCVPDDVYGRQSRNATPEKQDTHGQVPRLRAGVRGLALRTIGRPQVSKTTHLPPTALDDVGYSCVDFKRVQTEYNELKQKQEKLLDRIHRTDLEMEVQLKTVAQTLAFNNNTLKLTAEQLKDTREQLRSSQAMIHYLQNVILAKDLEIESLRKVILSTEQGSSDLTEQNSTIPVHPGDYDTSEESLVFLDDA